MDENKFWLCIWGLVGAILCVIVLALLALSAYNSSKIANLIAAGHDPIEVACAVSGFGGGTGSTICALRGAK